MHLICDNLATHKTRAIRDWLARHPRFHMHFTPTGSSWINQVERWFGLLTDQLLRRGVHKSVAALEKDVRDWIRTWNDDPKPFRWTKTADEILDSLAKYMERILKTTHQRRITHEWLRLSYDGASSPPATDATRAGTTGTVASTPTATGPNHHPWKDLVSAS